MKILVTGATGHFGGSAINFLLKDGVKPEQISAFVRSESKARDLAEKGIQVKIGDYNNVESVLAALRDVDKLLLVSGTDIRNRDKQHENVIHSAIEKKIRHIVYTSFQRHNETTTSPIALVAQAHVKTEKVLKDSKLPYTIMRNNLYLEMLPLFIGEDVLDRGAIYLPAGEGKAAYTSRDDMAEVAAKIILSDDHNNKEYDITNEEAVSFSDIASYLSEIKGKTVNYISPSIDEFNQTLKSKGVSVDAISSVESFALAIKQGEFDKTSNDIHNLIGRKPVRVMDYIQSVYNI